MIFKVGSLFSTYAGAGPKTTSITQGSSPYIRIILILQVGTVVWRVRTC